MPHVGGGSNVGGFHSGGSHSGSSNYVPKTDIYGKTHSRYYIRPGFYIYNMYVPYSRVHRGFNAVRRYLLFFIVALVFLALGIALCFKPDTDLENYSLNRYSQIYDHNDSYEYNLLIEIVLYDDKKELDYMPIVGDDVSKTIDEIFGNQNSLFGGEFFERLEKNEDKVSNLGSVLSESLNKTLEKISNKYYTANQLNSKIINNTSFNIGDSNIEEVVNTFYITTGYNIIIDINPYSEAYKPNYVLGIVLGAFSLVLLGIGVACISVAIKAVKKINEADRNGELKKYYEGEEKYEDHIKKHPIDEPYVYNKKEYEDLKKEFTIDKSKFEIDENEYK